MTQKLRKSRLCCLFPVLFVLPCTVLYNRFTPDARWPLIVFPLAVFVLCGIKLFLCRKKDNFTEILVSTILLMGIVMRIVYMLKNEPTTRHHDWGQYSTDGSGHVAYILNLLDGHLPAKNSGTLYEQPFPYLLMALFSKGLCAVVGKTDTATIIRMALTVPCCASCITLVLSDHFIVKHGGKDARRVFADTLVAFMPTFYLSAGDIAPDALVTLFLLLEVMYTIEWMKNDSWKHTVLLALIFGFGVMTKISCAVMAFPTLAVFLIRLYREKNRNNTWLLLLKYGAFALIALPLGLWFNVRNAVKFAQPLGYVQKFSTTDPLYTGARSIFTRLFYIDFENIMLTPYADPFKDYSYPVYAFKGTLFGEYSFNVIPVIPILLEITAAVLGLLIIKELFINVKPAWRCIETRYTMICFAVLAIFMAIFYLQYPFGCSMDFRYMQLFIIMLALLIARPNVRQLGNSATVTLSLFAALSIAMYLLV